MDAVDELNMLLGIGPPKPKLPITLQKSGYTPVRTLGKGAFGQAHLIFHAESQKSYVAKHVNMNTMTPKQRREAHNEIHVLQQLEHPNIVRYVEFFEEQNRNLYIVMEYADGGDLYTHLKKVRQGGGALTEEQVISLFTQVTMAIKHMHDRRILHRDIKTQNIFLTKQHVVKLGDFGISTVLQNTMQFAKTMCGTPCYFSPELCQGQPYNNKSDVWALGVLLYEMTSNRLPFESTNMKKLMEDITRTEPPRIHRRYSEDLWNLVKQMLQKDPARRPDVNGVLRSAVLRNAAPKIASQLEAQVPVVQQQMPGTGQSPRRGQAGQARAKMMADFGYNAPAIPTGADAMVGGLDVDEAERLKALRRQLEQQHAEKLAAMQNAREQSAQQQQQDYAIPAPPLRQAQPQQQAQPPMDAHSPLLPQVAQAQPTGNLYNTQNPPTPPPRRVGGGVPAAVPAQQPVSGVVDHDGVAVLMASGPTPQQQPHQGTVGEVDYDPVLLRYQDSDSEVSAPPVAPPPQHQQRRPSLLDRPELDGGASVDEIEEDIQEEPAVQLATVIRNMVSLSQGSLMGSGVMSPQYGSVVDLSPEANDTVTVGDPQVGGAAHPFSHEHGMSDPLAATGSVEVPIDEAPPVDFVDQFGSALDLGKLENIVVERSKGQGSVTSPSAHDATPADASQAAVEGSPGRTAGGEEDAMFGGTCVCGTLVFTGWLSYVYGSFTSTCKPIRRMSGASAVEFLHLPDVRFAEIASSRDPASSTTILNAFPVQDVDGDIGSPGGALSLLSCRQCGAFVGIEAEGLEGCAVAIGALDDNSEELLRKRLS